MTEPVLRIEKRGPVDWVTLNRPEALNSLDPELIDALNAYFESLERDYDTRVVVLRGEGDMFTSGNDVGEFAARAEAQGVLIEPGDVFFHGAPPARRAFRLGYASIEAKAIEPGIRILGGLVEAMLAEAAACD